MEKNQSFTVGLSAQLETHSKSNTYYYLALDSRWNSNSMLTLVFVKLEIIEYR
ncbi:hypothetical protein KC19_9G147800 [Ceratodon purpureus]|uniref:Uncharacterized protein n=1 Tax=Ceratodon purpureus TaxID=3225 RepID=A0A8T0GWE8_CERPU|nr:hypothetical protein KC19_9G147800 [Ceratodon purpureus]